MEQFLLNLWNAQRNAANLCALESRHEWLIREHKQVSEDLEDAISERNAVIELAITLAVGYRGAIGNPTDTTDIPTCIQEAHALRGRHTKWGWRDDKVIGSVFAEKMIKNEAAKTKQYNAAGLGEWKGWNK